VEQASAQLGAALDRNLFERAERGEQEIDAFITRRASQEQRIRAEQEAWIESARKYNVERQRRLAEEWREWHYQMADRCRTNLIDFIRYHEREAEKYDRMLPEREPSGAA